MRAAALLSGGISSRAMRRLETEAERAWLEIQHAISARRDAARAEMCTCGHDRGAHIDDVASCHGCRCCSFELAKNCCGARCRHCDTWRTLEFNEPKAEWCSQCRATTYRGKRGECLPCGDER